MNFNGFEELTLDLVDRCEANDELDEIKRPETNVELFDAWERAHQDRKELIMEIKKLRGSAQVPNHEIYEWPGAVWDPTYCFDKHQNCFCAWSYYYGVK